MTAEIVLMNKSAVALAADSAVTVGAGNSEKKVFNTASKVFALSKYAPVGIMIYSGADFCGIPWETIIKDYRSRLGKKRFSTLAEYKRDFFKDIEKNNRFFKNDQKEGYLAAAIYNIFNSLWSNNTRIPSNKILKQKIDIAILDLDKKDFIDSFSEASIKKIITAYDKIIDDVSELVFKERRISGASCKLRCRKFIALTLSKNLQLQNNTGIVISGFGEDEVFPSLKASRIDIFIFDKIRETNKEVKAISFSNPSDIAPFAQTQMMDSVLSGVLPSYNSGLLIETYMTILSLPNEIINNISELDKDKKAEYINLNKKAGIGLIQEIQKTANKLQADRLSPMKEAISVMPKSELASVAEIFLNTAQLEHRLSLAAETVGGPVDVAIISKGDGLVWIKRKHYFEPSLNASFIENYLQKDYIK